MNEATQARLTEVLAKQRPYQHGIMVMSIKFEREHPDWVEDLFFLGTHDECDRWFQETIVPDATIDIARGTCMKIGLN